MAETNLNDKHLKYVLDVRTRLIQWQNLEKEIFVHQKAQEQVEESLQNIKEDLRRLNEELNDVFAEERECLGMLLKCCDASLDGTVYFVCQEYHPTIGEGGGFSGYRIFFGDGKIQTETNIEIETVVLKEYYRGVTDDSEKRDICKKVATSYRDNLCKIILSNDFLTKGKEKVE